MEVKSGSAPTTWDLIAEFESSLKLEEIEGDISPLPVDNSNPLKPTASKDETTSSKSGSALPSGPITEDEVRALLQGNPMTVLGLVKEFRSRLKLEEEKDALAAIVKRITRLQEIGASKLVFLREEVKSMKDEHVLLERKPVTIRDLEAKFKSRLNLKEIEDDNESTASCAGSGTPSTLKSSVGKRRINGEESKSNRPTKRASKSGRVTEDEIRALLRGNPMTIRDFARTFCRRVKTKRRRDAFGAILRRIARKVSNGDSFVENLVVLREEAY